MEMALAQRRAPKLNSSWAGDGCEKISSWLPQKEINNWVFFSLKKTVSKENKNEKLIK